MGVIDAIADGCFAVARRPYLLLPPIALDLWYWLGDRLTSAPLIEAVLRTAAQAGPVDATTVTGLRQLEGDFNLFALLALGIRVLLPNITSDALARPWPQGVLTPGGWPLVILAAVVLGLAGVFALAIYLAGLAQAVRGEPFDARALVRRAPVFWLRLLGLAAIVTGGILLLALPVVLLAVVLVLAGVNPGPLLVLTIVPLLWLYFFLALAPEAIVVSDVGPFDAIRLSVKVVRRNFWAMLGLLAATLLIAEGFPLLWGQLTRQLAGVPIAIVGNAFLVTGLTAAAMYFYRDRQAALDAPMPQTPPGRATTDR